MSRFWLAAAIALSLSIASSAAHAAAPRDSGNVSPLESLPQSIWEVSADSVCATSTNRNGVPV